MTLKHGFKFSTPYAWGSNSPPPEDNDSEILFPPGRQRGQMSGVCLGGGGVLKLRFDQYIKVQFV